jgi:hypothetical protein
LVGLGATLEEMRQSLADLQRVVADFSSSTREAILGGPGQAKLVIEPFPAALMFGATSPHLSTGDRVQLLRHLAEAYGGPSGRIDELAVDAPVETDHAWSQGYELAESVLDDLGVQGETQDSVDVSAILQDLGVEIAETHLETALSGQLQLQEAITSLQFS